MAWRGWFVVAIVAAVVVIVVVVSVVLLVVLFVVAVVVGVAAVLVVAAVVPFRCGRCPVRPLISCVPCFLCCLWILLVCAIRASCVMCGLLAPCAFGADLLFFCVCLSCFSRLSRVSCDTRRLPMWGLKHIKCLVQSTHVIRSSHPADEVKRPRWYVRIIQLTCVSFICHARPAPKLNPLVAIFE